MFSGTQGITTVKELGCYRKIEVPMIVIRAEKSGSVDLIFAAPPSKSYTHRALIAAALADGKTTIFRPLEAEDTRLDGNAPSGNWA